jgi:S-DNA-T family DNA segregation ATPase FtsK/SpoIIIE
MHLARNGAGRLALTLKLEFVQRCNQCGFVYEDLASGEIGTRLRSAPPLYRQAFYEVSPAATRRHPEDGVWSALEYACHVRDVLLVQRERAVLAQLEQRPNFARMYRDERVSLCRYAGQSVEEALSLLEMAARLCALVFESRDDAAWSRRIVYNWPEPAEHDLAWLGRHTIHEVEHHLQDVAVVLRRGTADDPRTSPPQDL